MKETDGKVLKDFFEYLLKKYCTGSEYDRLIFAMNGFTFSISFKVRYMSA